MAKRQIKLPAEYHLHFKLNGNAIFQLKEPTFEGEVDAEVFDIGNVKGEVFSANGRRVAVVPKKVSIPEGIDAVFVTPDGKAPGPGVAPKGSWLKNADEAKISVSSLPKRQQDVTASWKDQFSFIEETNSGGQKTPGLRHPQIGAVHATIGHWKMSSEHATVVMPTGTGKTETMVALMIHQRPDRILVVVPSDALRTQVSSKFIALGLLKVFGICRPTGQYPIVGILSHKPKSAEQIKLFFESCNVVVSTMALLARFQDDEQKLLSTLNSHLFIDEAHHIKAETWSRLRDHFAGRLILQFTATPFRNDGRHVDGRVIFNYPLRRAQDEGYFTRINLIPLLAFDPDEADQTIAESAIEQLKADLEQGHDHLVMARASSISKAEQLQTLYAEIANISLLY